MERKFVLVDPDEMLRDVNWVDYILYMLGYFGNFSNRGYSKKKIKLLSKICKETGAEVIFINTKILNQKYDTVRFMLSNEKMYFNLRTMIVNLIESPTDEYILAYYLHKYKVPISIHRLHNYNDRIDRQIIRVLGNIEAKGDKVKNFCILKSSSKLPYGLTRCSFSSKCKEIPIGLDEWVADDCIDYLNR